MLEEETSASISPSPVSVAVVDDDPTARRLMRFWLERAGYNVVEHESARSVLDHDGESPGLACVDLGLGEVTGIKVIQHLKARDAELPIIVVTAQRELETAISAMQAALTTTSPSRSTETGYCSRSTVPTSAASCSPTCGGSSPR